MIRKWIAGANKQASPMAWERRAIEGLVVFYSSLESISTLAPSEQPAAMCARANALFGESILSESVVQASQVKAVDDNYRVLIAGDPRQHRRRTSRHQARQGHRRAERQEGQDVITTQSATSFFIACS